MEFLCKNKYGTSFKWWMFHYLCSVIILKSSQFHFSARSLLRKQNNAHNSLLSVSHRFPGSSQAIYSQARLSGESAVRWCTYRMWFKREAWRRGSVFPTQWQFSLLSEQLPYIPGSLREELSSAWSGRYIPVGNGRPLIIVIEETRQPSWQLWMGGWTPCHSHSL